MDFFFHFSKSKRKLNINTNQLISEFHCYEQIELMFETKAIHYNFLHKAENIAIDLDVASKVIVEIVVQLMHD